MNFHDFLFRRFPGSAYGMEPFADIPYSQEVRIKNEALVEFWKEHRLGGTLEPLVEAVLPRKYRTTSKRRACLNEQRGFSLGFGERAEPGVCAVSHLEPDSHNAIYAALFDKLSTSAFKPLARFLNWIIVRGSYTQVCVIFNVTKMDATIVRKLKQLGEFLPTLGLGVVAAMVYVDPTRSDYYLEAERPQEGMQSKHLFGPRLLTLAVGEARLKYPPTVFSQVNEAMVPRMVEEAKAMLQPTAADRLLDLYCGYGLFSFTLGRLCKESLGIEMEGDSIATAKESALRGKESGKLRFLAARITGESLRKTLSSVAPCPEILLLDPPRKGTDPGVISLLAARNPRKILHICCGTDEIVPAVKEWNQAGYQVERALPLDLFAGTPNLETMISIVKK